MLEAHLNDFSLCRVRIAFCFFICLLYSILRDIYVRQNIVLGKNTKATENESIITDEIRDKYFALYKEIVICGQEGHNLSGYSCSQEGISTWIIFLHGYRGRCTNMLKYMEYFREAGGFNLLTIDLRGHGKRNEKYFSCGSAAETDDIMQWVNWIKSKNKKAHVILFGVSLGGITAINTAGKNPLAFDGVIADSTPSSFETMIKRVLHHKCGFLSNLIMPLVTLYARIFAKLKIEETSSIEQAAKVKCPILLIHSKDDHFVPIRMMHDIYEHLTVTDKEYLEISGAAHTVSRYQFQIATCSS